MSKWIDKDLFNTFQNEKKEEKQKPQNQGGVRRSDLVWDTPEKGTETIPKEYQGRFLPDPNGIFYKKYFYHMFRTGEKWIFMVCDKTDNFENFCPWCSASMKLYTGSAADKKLAKRISRKKKFVGNFYIVKDFRDEEKDPEDKVAGTVRLYEFPEKVEMKLSNEITDSEEGLGASIFDPSDAGYNFILKVLSTKPMADGTVWPDYSNSAFARRASALGTDKEIEEIMGNRLDVQEYVDSLKKSDDEIEKALKDEMLFDLVKDEWYKTKGRPAVESKDEQALKELESTEDPFDTEEESPSEQTDQELLAELENL